MPPRVLTKEEQKEPVKSGLPRGFAPDDAT